MAELLTAKNEGEVTRRSWTFPAPLAAANLDRDAAWQNLPAIELNRAVRKDRRLNFSPTRMPAPAWDELRTRTALAMAENQWRVLGITSPRPGCGRTTLALNLALGLARQSNRRVVVVDLNLRKPGLAPLLRIKRFSPLSLFLTGDATVQQSFMRIGDNLGFGFNTQPETRASEVLLDAAAQLAMAELHRQLTPDIVILDLPAMLGSDEVLACLPMLDCVLMAVEAERSSFGEVDFCERELSDRTSLLGVVLNKCHHGPDRYGL